MSERAERLSLTVGVSVLTTMLLMLLAAKNIRLKQLEQNGDNGGCENAHDDRVAVPAEPGWATLRRVGNGHLLCIPVQVAEGGGAPVRDAPAHKGEVFVAEGADGLALDHAGIHEPLGDDGLLPADDDDVGGLGDPAKKPVLPFVHADNSTTNAAKGGN